MDSRLFDMAGYYREDDSDISMQNNMNTARNNTGNMSNGSAEYRNGMEEYRRGMEDLRQGLEDLRQGEEDYRNGLEEARRYNSNNRSVMAGAGKRNIIDTTRSAIDSMRMGRSETGTTNMRTRTDSANTINVVPNCPNNGILTMAFVNMQPLCKVYSVEDGLKNGTLFPELNKPFYGGAWK